ncbi:MAG: phage tail tape measure protein [Mariniphaga sp.]
MATSYDRRISFYINGKEISNDIKSIRAEMTKLINEQARMKIGSQEYMKTANGIKSLKGIIAEHNEQISGISKSWSLARMGDSFNRYFSMIQAGAAAVVGLVLGFKALVKVYNDFEEQVSNLSALTGLSGRPLEWLSQQAKDLSTTTLDGSIRVTQSAQDIVDAFTKMGSARPELLKNKEDLVEVTKQALILAEASKMKMEPAIVAVAACMNQFSLGASEAGRIINVLGAGSLEGSAEVEHLTKSLSTVGTVAHNSNLTLEQTIGILETLAERQLKGEEAGTQLKSSLISLKAAGLGYSSGIFNVRDAVVELKAKMDASGDSIERDSKLIEVFGKRNITVGTILTSNLSRFDYFSKAVAGTTVALRQAAVNSDNNNAKLAQAGNRITNIANELGGKLTPAMHALTGYFGTFLKCLIVLIEVFGQYGRVIVTTTLAIAGYTIAVKLQTLWQGRANQATLLQIITQKAQAAITSTLSFLNGVWSISLMLVTGNIKGATAAMRVLTSTMKLNPIGLITSLIIAGASAYQYYTEKKKEAAEAANSANNILKEEQSLLAGYSAEIIKEKNNLGTMIGAILRTNEGEQMRVELIKRLKEQYPGLLGYLDGEKISNKELKLILADVNLQYGEKIKLAALRAGSEALNNASVKAEERKLAIEDELLEIEKQRFRIGDKKSDEQVSVLNKEYEQLNLNLAGYKKKQEDIAVSMTKINDQANESKTVAGVEKQLTAQLNARAIYSGKLKIAQEDDKKSEAEFYQQQIDLTDDQINLLNNKKKGLLAAQLIAPGSTDDDEVSGHSDLVKLKERELAAAKELPGSTIAEITYRNQKVEGIEKEIAALNNLGKAHNELVEKEDKIDSRKDKKTLERLQAENSKQIALINENHLKGLSTDEQYKAELVAQEFVFQQSKVNSFKKGSKLYEEAVAAFNTLMVTQSESFKQRMLDADNALDQAKLDNLKDKIDKEKAIEELRWKNELIALKKQLVVRLQLKTEEKLLNDKINATIAEKTKEHNHTVNKLDQAGLIQQQMNKALIHEAGAYSDEQKWKAGAEKNKAQFEQDLLDADDNEVLKAQAERRYADGSLKIKEEQITKEYGLKEEKLKNISDLTGAMITAVGIETDLGKALYLFQQGLAIASIWTEYGKQLMLINTQALMMGPIAGPIWAATQDAKATVTAAVATAVVLGQTVANMTNVGGKKKKGGYSEGGFTTPGDKMEVAGVVHRGEYIIPQEGVKNRSLLPFIGAIEEARKNHSLLNLDLNPLMIQSQISGDYKLSGQNNHVSSIPKVSSLKEQPGQELELTAAVKELNRQLKVGIKANAYINKYGRNGLDEAISDISKFKKQVYKS